MKDQTLRALVAESDANQAPPVLATGLAKRVRSRARTRAARRVATMALVVISGATVIRFAERGNAGRSLVADRISEPSTQLNRERRGDDPRTELTRLGGEAAMHEEIISQLLATEARSIAQRKLAAVRSDAHLFNQLAMEREAAAAILLAGGDDLLHTAGGKEAATERYRSVLELFSDTRVAPAAQERLKQLST